MLRLVPVTRDNFEEVIELCVSPEQERFVGTPAEALAYWHFYPERMPFAIELGTQLIGLVMYDIASAPDVLRLQRLLIDCAHQRRGYARRILALIVERARRAGKTRVELAVHRDASAAIALYTAFGFILTNNDSDHFDATYAVSAL